MHAGLLLFLVALEEATGDRMIREWAVELGEQLLTSARTTGDDHGGIYWEVPSIIPGGPTHSTLGLLHGSAGIGLALLRLGLSFHQDQFISAAVYVGELLLSAMRQEWRADRRCCSWPRTLDDERVHFSAHCHGAGGIGQFLLRLGYHVRDGRFLEAARGAAYTVAARDPGHSSQCHGLAGDGALFLDLLQATGDQEFQVMVYNAGYRLAEFRKPVEPGVWTQTRNGDVSPDYMTGIAGIGAFCLRLASPTSAEDIILPTPTTLSHGS